MTRIKTPMALAGTALPPWRPGSAPAAASWTTQRTADRHRDWLAGRLAIRQAFRVYFREAAPVPPNAHVAYRANGQPYISSAPAVCCSVAHSHGWALAGISASPIGVDIERIRCHHPALLACIAAPEEIARVAACVAGVDQLLTVLWTMKEAVMKATGEGLRIPPRRVRIDQFDRGIAHAIVTDSGVSPREFQVATARKGLYYMSIAYQEEGDDVPRITWFKPSRLPASRSLHTA